jgi:hypothetical protein
MQLDVEDIVVNPRSRGMRLDLSATPGCTGVPRLQHTPGASPSLQQSRLAQTRTNTELLTSPWCGLREVEIE